MKQRHCNIEGCDQKHWGKGFCKKHYEADKRLERKKTISIKAQKLCSINECNRPHYARGFCSKHYKAIRAEERRNGAPKQKPGPKKQPKSACIAPGCSSMTHAKGYCQPHYNRLQRHGVLELPIVEPIICSVQGCEERARSKSLCHLHYSRFRKYGSTEPTPYMLRVRGTVDKGYRRIWIKKNAELVKILEHR